MDEHILLWINQGWGNALFDGLFWWVSQRPEFTYPLALLLLYDCSRREGRAGARLFLVLLLTITVGDLLGHLLKDLFAMPRPCQAIFEQLRALGGGVVRRCGDKPNGMPSNHALNFTAAAVFVLWTLPWRRWRLGLVALAVLVGLSRIYLGKHYPSQVLAGALIGLALGTLAAWLAIRYRRAWGLPAFVGAGLSPEPVEGHLTNSVHPSTSSGRTEISVRPEPVEGSKGAGHGLSPPVFSGMPSMNAEPISPAALAPHRLSLVVPLYNEQDNVEPLLAGIHAALADYPMPWELIVVDDGSSDGTHERLRDAASRWGRHVRVLELQRNFGQTAAMQAGIDAARGEVIATLDGDLQNDPADIPRLVGRLLSEDLDLVVGWRRNRQDNVWLRTIPSRIANRLIGNITQVRLHDYGCSLKVYRATVIKEVRLYGEMHRFIPAWMSVRTAPQRIREDVVNHRARMHGESKYGISRTFRVLVDLLSVYFFLRFLTRPGHFFGRIGLVSGGLGTLLLGWLFAQKLLLGANIGTRPLLLVAVLLVLMGVQFLTTGVLSELITRTYFASSASRPYVIRTIGSDGADAEAGWCVAHG
ncbi:MAG: glycosyltransferase [Candidatus Competibacteraceae bacterium]|nr:MAG: glycosyltransferase [Candidatus Competibacteraceae bacterium]